MLVTTKQQSSSCRCRSTLAGTLMLLLILVQWVDAAFGSYQWYCDLSYEPIVDVQWDPLSRSYVVLPGSGDNNDDDNGDNGERHRRLMIQSNHPQHEQEKVLLRGSNDSSQYVYQERALQVLEWGGKSSSSAATADAAAATSSSSSQHRNLDQPPPTTTTTTTAVVDIIQARRCYCWKDLQTQHRDDEKEINFYCPLARSYCGVGSGWTYVRESTMPPLISSGGGSMSAASSSETLYLEDPGCLDISRQQILARNVWPIITVW